MGFDNAEVWTLWMLPSFTNKRPASYSFIPHIHNWESAQHNHRLPCAAALLNGILIVNHCGEGGSHSVSQLLRSNARIFAPVWHGFAWMSLQGGKVSRHCFSSIYTRPAYVFTVNTEESAACLYLLFVLIFTYWTVRWPHLQQTKVNRKHNNIFVGTWNLAENQPQLYISVVLTS